MRILSRLLCLATVAASTPLALAQVPNDTCATALQIVRGYHAISTIQALSGPTQGHCGSHGAGAMGKDIWFRYTASVSGEVNVSICDADFDTMLELYPDNCTTATPIRCSDDDCQLGSGFGFTVMAGESRLIRLGGFGSQSGGTGTLVIIDSEEGPLGRPICLAEPNSTGGRGALRAFGSAVPSLNNLTLRAVSLPHNSLTMFLASDGQGTVVGPGGSAGTLCIGPDVARFVGQAGIAVNGIYSIPVNLQMIPLPPTFADAVGSYDTWYFQAWFRDASPTGPTSNFSSAIEVRFSFG